MEEEKSVRKTKTWVLYNDIYDF